MKSWSRDPELWVKLLVNIRSREDGVSLDSDPFQEVSPAVGTGLGSGRLNSFFLMMLGPAQVGSSRRFGPPGGDGMPVTPPRGGPSPHRERRRRRPRHRLFGFCRTHLHLRQAKSGGHRL